MLKYVETKVTFSEIPDEITLCINISNCKCKCKNCHSPYLTNNVGNDLTDKVIDALILKNEGISCICFMGGDSAPHDIKHLAMYIKKKYPKLKVAWYSGKELIPLRITLNIHNFDFIKLGPYKEEYGPLNFPTTNQRLYKVNISSSKKYDLEDITYKFWNKENDTSKN